MLYTTLSTAGIAIEENLVRICLVLFFFFNILKNKKDKENRGRTCFYLEKQRQHRKY